MIPGTQASDRAGSSEPCRNTTTSSRCGRPTCSNCGGSGAPALSSLPFAVHPDLLYPGPPASAAEWTHYAADVVFAGGADRDRVPYLSSLIQAGLRVALYG